MGQSKAGWWIAGAVAGIVLISIGYGMGRRASASLPNASGSVTPAGAPLPTLQIEPIQPHEELKAMSTAPSTSEPAAPSGTPEPSGSAAPVLTPPSTTVPVVEDSARVREIQRALKVAGFDPGPVDGHLGQRTKTAVRDFQLAQGLQPDGKVGPRTWSKLETYLKKEAASSTTASTTTAGD